MRKYQLVQMPPSFIEIRAVYVAQLDSIVEHMIQATTQSKNIKERYVFIYKYLMAPIVKKQEKKKQKKMALRSGHLFYKKEDSPNIKFINKNFPNIGLTIKKYDVNLMQFFIIDNNDNPVKRIPENINCFVYEKTKKIEKKKKNIEEIESWITL